MSVYPVFSGPYHQRGFGAPHLWLRTIKPLLKKIGLRALKHGAKIGSRVVHDISKGEKFSDSLKNRTKQTINEITGHSNDIQKRNIKHRRIGKKVTKPYYRRATNNNKSDIFHTT